MRKNVQKSNYMRDKKNRQRVILEEKDKSLKSQAERKEQNEEKHGKQKHSDLIVIGANDRVNGVVPQVFEDETMKVSYSYGYFERGTRILEGKFVKGECTPEEQRKFGIIDFLHGIPEKYINSLKEYPSYIEGRVYQMGNSAYEFCLENNLSFEEYVEAMGFIYPEVKTDPFKLGYETRKKELDSENKTISTKHK